MIDISSETKIAVLIDAENTHHSILDATIKELSKYGHILVKKAYGDWSSSRFSFWKEPLNDLAINLVHQTSGSSGCQCSDSAMIIDAMDLLHSNKFDAFALVSNGSGLTKLASRLKESERYVVGVGEKHTPAAFRNVVDDFLYAEALKDSYMMNHPPLPCEHESNGQEQEATSSAHREIRDEVEFLDILREAVVMYQNEEGWSLLAHCGGLIKRQYPDFSAQNYGFASLSQLVEATELFDINHKETDSGVAHIYIKER